jgi:glycosyltransferase involved in cell wall biosynthesis
VIEAFAADPARVRVVQPGVPPLPDLEPDVARPLVEPFLPSGVSRYVLAIGTAEPRKDLPGLVRAFDHLAERHADLALVLAGPPGWGEDALATALERARFKERVVRTGWLQPLALAALLKRASVLAFPSLYEGFGFPPLEAMSAGVPVVATRAGSLPEVLGDGASMVDVGDGEGLVAALDRILDDPVVRDRLVAAGTKQAASFSWERCGEGLAELYRDVAAARDA